LKELVSYVEDFVGDDCHYAIDVTKFEAELGWSAQETFDTGIVNTSKMVFTKIQIIARFALYRFNNSDFRDTKFISKTGALYLIKNIFYCDILIYKGSK